MPCLAVQTRKIRGLPWALLVHDEASDVTADAHSGAEELLPQCWQEKRALGRGRMACPREGAARCRGIRLNKTDAREHNCKPLMLLKPAMHNKQRHARNQSACICNHVFNIDFKLIARPHKFGPDGPSSRLLLLVRPETFETRRIIHAQLVISLGPIT